MNPQAKKNKVEFMRAANIKREVITLRQLARIVKSKIDDLMDTEELIGWIGTTDVADQMKRRRTLIDQVGTLTAAMLRGYGYWKARTEIGGDSVIETLRNWYDIHIIGSPDGVTIEYIAIDKEIQDEIRKVIEWK